MANVFKQIVEAPGKVVDWTSEAWYGLAGGNAAEVIQRATAEKQTGSAQVVDAKMMGNTAYSSQSLYQEQLLPGSIDTSKYKK